MKIFQLPNLPYGYDALAPHIDGETMRLHHTRHHRAYVDKLNEALSREEQAFPSRIEELLRKVDSYGVEVRNHGGGHYNHSLFWESLTPQGPKQPSGQLAVALTDAFGSVPDFIQKFSNQAATLFGSGWTWLCVRGGGQLEMVTMPNQDNPLMDEARYGLPILGLDVWEHAYYLHYQNRRADYIAAFWHIVDWDVVAGRYDAAQK